MKRAAASERTQRSYKLSHQRLVITSIDFTRQYVTGFTELTIYPLRKLSAINLNSRQAHIIRATVAGVSVPFEVNDAQAQLTKPSKKRALDGFAVNHQQSLNASHLDLGGSGELTLKLSHDVQNLVQERKPLQISVEFSLEKPKGGLHFVIPPGEEPPSKCSAHMFSYQYGNLARMWFPCIDMLAEICTWTIEINVPVDMTAISCGQLVEQVLSDDERSKTFVFNLPVPTSACKIGLVVGAFEVVVDAKVPEMTYFCPPGLSGLLHHCTAFLHEVFGFYEDVLSTRFPYSCYKMVFVDESYAELASFASMSVVSVYALHSPRYIEPTFNSRQLLSLALAQQYFGCFLCPKSWNEVWLATGASAYIQLLFQRRMFGNSHYRCILKQAEDTVCRMENETGGLPALHPKKVTATSSSDGAGDQDTGHHGEETRSSSLHPHALHGGASAWSSETFGRDRVRLQEALDQKSLLVMHMLTLHTDQDCIMQALNKLLALALSASQQSIICGAWNSVLLSTDTFVRAVTSLSVKSLDTFLQQWIYQRGCTNFVAKFAYNRKRNGLEVHIQQDSTHSNARYTGPLTITVQELDGPVQHVVQIESVDRSYEIPCHSKARRTKKKRISLVTGEEVDMDLSLVESDSPVLWLRLDPDMAWLRTIRLEQPDYMWQLQVVHERDVVGQIEACEAITRFPTANTRKVLSDAICHQRFYYRVRCCAAQSLASVVTNSEEGNVPHSALTGLYRKIFGCQSQRDMVRLNDFSNLAEYYVQKEIPLALSQVRNSRNQCPREIVTFLNNLVKHNDNRTNQYSDTMMITSLLTALTQTVTQSEPGALVHPASSNSSVTSAVSSLAPEAALVVNEMTQHLNMEKLISSYGGSITIRCLTGLSILQQYGHIIGCLDIFKRHAAYGLVTDVRLAALQGVVNHVQAEASQDELMWLFDLVESDPNPAVRVRIVRMLIDRPPFTRKSSSPLNNEAVVDRLWQLLTVSSSPDMQLRACLGELYGVLYGWLTPSCVPASGLGLVIDLKKKKSRTHMAADKTPTTPSDKVDRKDPSIKLDLPAATGSVAAGSPRPTSSATPRTADESDSALRLKIKVASPRPDSRVADEAADSSMLAASPAAPIAMAASDSQPLLATAARSASGVDSATGPALAPLIVKNRKRSHSEMSKKDKDGGGERLHKKSKKEKHKHKKHKHHHKDAESKEAKKASASSSARPPNPFFPSTSGS